MYANFYPWQELTWVYQLVQKKVVSPMVGGQIDVLF